MMLRSQLSQGVSERSIRGPWWTALTAAAALLCWEISASAQTLSLSSNDETLQAALERAALSLSPPEDASPADLVALAKGDYERLIALLYEQGFFAPQISITLAGREAASLSALRPPSQVAPIAISVTQGKRFQFGRAEIAPLPPGTTPPAGFAPGQVAGTTQIRRAAQEAVSAWRTASHAKADLSNQEITARHRDQTLDVTLTVSPGPALRFGSLRVDTDSTVRPKRLRAIAGLPEGAPFNPEDLRLTRERLLATGAFRSVVLTEAETPNEDGTLDIALAVEDAVPRRIGFGAELFSDQGLSLQAFWMHRNAFGGAERLRFDGSVNGIGGTTDGLDYALSTSLVIPGFRRPDDTLTAELGLEHLDEPTFESDIARAFLRRERRFSERYSVTTGFGVVVSESDTTFGRKTFQHLYLETRAIYDQRDDPLSPRSGYYAEGRLQPFIGLGDSETGVRLDLDGRLYRGLGARTVIAGRARLGVLAGPDLSETPPEQLYLSGGGGTVRGQPYQTLGVSVGDDTIGGRSFAGLSAEFRQSITDSIGLVAFADYGVIGEDTDFGNSDSHAGYGIGARYRTGFGALRVDLGLPTDDADVQALQIYIGLGEAF